MNDTPGCTSLLGFHSWGKWSAPFAIAEQTGIAAAFAGHQQLQAQFRYCKKCNAIETRSVIVPKIPEPQNITKPE